MGEGLQFSVAAACRRLAAAGLVRATNGNVSTRDGDVVAVTPTGARLGELRAEDVTLLDLDGRVVGGSRLAPTSEVDLHLALYERADAGAVVHTHAPVATALACVLHDELPCIHYEMLALGGAVRIAPYATFGTPELHAGVLEALDGHSAALMANHGTIARAGTLDAAVELTELLEWAATLYWRASAVGTPRALGGEALEAVLEQMAARRYGAMRPA